MSRVVHRSLHFAEATCKASGMITLISGKVRAIHRNSTTDQTVKQRANGGRTAASPRIAATSIPGAGDPPAAVRTVRGGTSSRPPTQGRLRDARHVEALSR